ncbi:sulfurtransferase-like selenium metabolism protein YedF [Thermosediminibacter oceani]|uniref:Selenium metabolism protein YedF n=1 Tax=Thermosediminibacter oceani (strain ATCC BAA-1034 / DSM 16646 / JW/IW-1228P) TaxID=555079 RepID=D9S190_THEOJ|nr:sulfurtransferase-like selenium metabolism protein YedF [Thermosediminibacter oceani]ADL08969.1 selenium metabolism protein YedF [Thermosediminibacter oceani DSM 16646]
MAIEVDCRGKKCPEPLIMTKKALDSIDRGRVVAIVDDEVARENIIKFAKNQGYGFLVETKGDNFYISIDKEAVTAGKPEKGGCCEVVPSDGSPYVLLVTGDTLGRGSEELGKLLLKNYFYSLKEAPRLPECALFLNRGVYLTTEGSEVLDTLRELESRGMEVMSCGTCLDYYGLKEKLAVGSITNMYTIAEKLSAFRTITI